MVQVAIMVDAFSRLQELLGGRRQSFRQDLPAFIGDAPPRRAVAIEDRDADQFAHRRHAEDAHFAGLPRTAEAVIFVEIARLDLGALRTACGRSRLLHEIQIGAASRQCGGAGHRRSSQQAATADARLGLFAFWIVMLLGHGVLLGGWLGGSRNENGVAATSRRCVLVDALRRNLGFGWKRNVRSASA